ncbi:MAG: hypothetical protein DMF82_06350 [Acidobacteria bacterium]|nr:MAG: hypothetical protein DMF82_06350 [Acidobacteriota bacterium]
MAMNTRKESCRGPATALALLTVAGLAWLSTAQASAQVGGSLIVTITSPTAGSTVSGTIPVAATVSMLGGLTVQGVQFKVDGANIGAEDTTAPYSVPWDTKTVANASHTLTAVARDALGVLWTSDPVAVTVFNDKTPPIIAITSPLSGAALRGTIAVNADATDNVGVVGVQFKLDGANLGAEDATSPYSVSWNTATASNASHTLSAVARDAAGNTATSTVTVTVDNVVPTVSITAPGGGAVVAGTTVVSASATDNVGVSGVQFLVDGSALGAEVTTAPYTVSWDTTTVATGAHSLTAVARDGAGNTTTSGAVTVTVSQTATRFEDTDLSIVYTDGVTAPGQPAGWWHGSRSRTWSNKTASFNRSQGAQARFSFTGTTVRWIGFLAPWAGIARVYVDDVFVTELDLYQPTEQTQAVVFSRTGLTNGPHSLTVESTGRKNASSVDYAVVVDAFDVAPALPLPATGTRVEETGLSFSAGWTSDSQPIRAWSGGTAAVSATAGAQASFTFTGTEARWVGLRGPQYGIASVSLDGAFQATVDTYAPAEIEGIVFIATTLAPGRHTLTINVTGTANAAATGSTIVVDAMDTRARIEDADASVTYTSDWRQSNFDKDWSGASPNTGTGSVALSRTAGGQATLSFSGTGVSWIGAREPSGGIAQVLVDGAAVAQVDTYASAEQVQVVLYSVSGLSDGPHTFTVAPTGQRNPSSIDSLVFVDAFDIAPSASAPTITRFQERDSSVTYSGNWTQGTVFSYWSGETAAYSGTAGDQATFTFTGTAVRWISQYGFNNGIANVLLDGVQVAQVDTFAVVQEQDQAPLFIATGLANTTHTLTIQVTGQKNPSAFNSWILVDAFDVY